MKRSSGTLKVDHAGPFCLAIKRLRRVRRSPRSSPHNIRVKVTNFLTWTSILHNAPSTAQPHPGDAA
eukprot:920600-Amphidinium_carterae.1